MKRASTRRGDARQILTPFDPNEGCSVAEATEQIGRCQSTTRNLCAREGLGRKIGGRIVVSRPALSMFLCGDHEALALYHAGIRDDPRVIEYFRRAGVPSTSNGG